MFQYSLQYLPLALVWAVGEIAWATWRGQLVTRSQFWWGLFTALVYGIFLPIRIIYLLCRSWLPKVFGFVADFFVGISTARLKAIQAARKQPEQ